VLSYTNFAYAESASTVRAAFAPAGAGREGCRGRDLQPDKSFRWPVARRLHARQPEVVAALARLKSYLDYGTFQPIQIASIVAMNEAPEYPREVNGDLPRRRDTLVDGLARIGWPIEKPKGTMFVWAAPGGLRGDSQPRVRQDARTGGEGRGLTGVGFGPGGEGFVRFALVENEQRIGQALRGIRKALVKLG